MTTGMCCLSTAKPAMCGPEYFGRCFTDLRWVLSELVSWRDIVCDIEDRRPSSGCVNLGSHAPRFGLVLYMLVMEFRMATICARIWARVMGVSPMQNSRVRNLLQIADHDLLLLEYSSCAGAAVATLCFLCDGLDV